MSNLPQLPDAAPSYLAALLANNPVLAATNEAALANMFAGMPPMIGVNASRFVIKDGGQDTLVTDANGHPVAVLGCVILAAKPQLEKKLYLTAYTPGSNAAPDCYSMNGIAPEADSSNKQAEACAGCWANVFGSGVDQTGNPTKGKRCSDIKKLALFANGKVYGFNIPPASLQNFTAYVRDLSARQIPLPAVITTIGFDIQQPQVLTFTYAGMLAQENLPAVAELCDSQAVKDVINFKMTAPTQLPAPTTQAALPPAAPQDPPAPPKPAAAPKSNRKPAAATTPAPDLGLGLPATPASDVVVDVAPASNPADLSDDALKSMLGL